MRKETDWNGECAHGSGGRQKQLAMFSMRSGLLRLIPEGVLQVLTVVQGSGSENMAQYSILSP